MLTLRVNLTLTDPTTIVGLVTKTLLIILEPAPTGRHKADDYDIRQSKVNVKITFIL